VIAISASIIFFVVVVGISTAIFGENLLGILNLPFYNLSRVYNAPIVERIDLYVIAFWFIPMACSMRCYVFAAFEGLQKVFNLKKTRILYTSYFTIVLILSCIPKDINQVFTFVEITNFAGMGVSVFIILCLFFSFIRKNGVSVK
ncbi:MAG TPA: GerAB/ArcD/ProY family transporter, partial [Clostridia bacterium]